jgi:hypothetical protein
MMPGWLTRGKSEPSAWDHSGNTGWYSGHRSICGPNRAATAVDGQMTDERATAGQVVDLEATADRIIPKQGIGRGGTDPQGTGGRVHSHNVRYGVGDR